MKRLIENKNVRFRTQFNSNLFSEQLQLTRVIFGGNFLSARISFETSWIELENPWLKVFLSKKAVQMTYAYDMVKSTGLRKLVEEAIQQAGKDEYRVFFYRKKGISNCTSKSSIQIQWKRLKLPSKLHESNWSWVLKTKSYEVNFEMTKSTKTFVSEETQTSIFKWPYILAASQVLRCFYSLYILFFTFLYAFFDPFFFF